MNMLSRQYLITLLACTLILPTLTRAQHPGDDVPGAQVLTRGPVHEAFAEIVTFNPEPGIVVTKAPPEAIEEMPPDERPEGINVTWIPGYWGWDDERSNFLWISGTWRALPPGREWMAGYWGKTPQGAQWISGYWADASVRETVYLPPPPITLEAGPNLAAPSIDYGWTPGTWVWYQNRYAWRPGYWVQGRADWNWSPAHYVWTPRGYVFVGGYWDYPVQRRGVLFAPVYFEASVYAQRGYRYSPTIAIDLGVFSDHLFLRPSYHHYYFGDYYAPSYSRVGFYASFSFHSGRHGYDPIYSHQRWEHRSDRDWDRHRTTTYEYRRDHENARPPHTWTAQRSINPGTVAARENRVMVAAPISQLAKRTDSPVRFQPVAQQEREQLSQRSRELQTSRDQRRTLEDKPMETRKPGATIEPAKVQLPRSPIVAPPANQLGRNQAPPKPQTTPKPDLKVQPRAEPPGRAPNVDRGRPDPEPRRPEPEKKGKNPGRSEAPAPKTGITENEGESQRRATEAAAKAQEEARNKAKAAEQAGQLEAQRKARDAAAKVQADAQKNAQEQANKTRQESERRASEAAAKAQEAARGKAKAAEQASQLEAQRKGKDAAAKAQADAQKNAREQEDKTRQESQRRANEATAKAQEDARSKAKAADKNVQLESLRRAKEAEQKARVEAAKQGKKKKGEPNPPAPETPPAPKTNP
jgi:hypothetical protein